MKKLPIIIAATVLAALPLAACNTSNNSVDYERISLDAMNYVNYIAVNFGYTDIECTLSDATTDYTNYYDVACIGNITTSKKADCLFENVAVTFYFSIDSYITPRYGCTLYLDIDGDAQGSFSCYARDVALSSLPQQAEITMVDIEGYVLVPQES